MIPRILRNAALALVSQFALAGPNHYQEPGISPQRDYLSQHFVERIDPFTGNLQLQYTDLFIPGTASFGIKVQRSYNSLTATSTTSFEGSSPFGTGWDINFGRVRYTDLYCVGSGPDSLVLELPDGSQQAFFKTNGIGGTNAASELLSKGLWKASCDSASGGIFVWSPDGTRYEMTTRDMWSSQWLTTRLVDRNGNQISYTYRSLGPYNRLAPETISMGGTTLVTFAYDTTQAKLISITSQGRTWQYTVTTLANGYRGLTQVQPPAGQNWTYTYFGNRGAQAGGYLIQQVTYPQGGTVNYDYGYQTFFTNTVGSQVNTVVTSKREGINNTWTFNYTPSSGTGSYDTTTVTQPPGMPSITYKHWGYRTVANGNTWKIGLLAQKATGNQQMEDYTWDNVPISNESIIQQGYVTKDTGMSKPVLASRTIHRDGATYTTNYQSPDAFGNPQYITETGNRTLTHSSITYYHNFPTWILGLKSGEVQNSVQALSRSFATNGNLNSETKFGVTTSYQYHGDGNLSARTNARGFTTYFPTYERGVPKSEQRPAGVNITRDMDLWGNVVSESNGEGTWTYSYDGLNRLTSIGYPVGTGATITWPLRQRHLARGNYVDETDFDAFGRVTSRERGNILVLYEYDALGRKVFESFPDSASGTRFTLDDIGRVTHSTSPHGNRTYSYSGNSTTVTNERGIATTYQYDRTGDPDGGFVTNIESPAGTSVAIPRDFLGNMETVTQGGVTRRYYYNGQYFLTSIDEPETGVTTFGRDALGNPISKTVGGSTIVYTYDGLDRLTNINYPGTTPSTTIDYNKRSLVTRVSNTIATRDYAYDNNGNQTLDQLMVDGRVFATSYGYDLIDGLSSITYPSQMSPSNRVVTISPDALGRPTNMSPFLGSIGYTPSGNLQSISYQNGVLVTIGEDSSRLLPNSIHSGQADIHLNYGYDGVGNVSALSGNNGPIGFSGGFGYDGADRLASADGPWGTSQFTYSGAGNITFKRIGDDTVNYTYASGNRLTSVSLNGQPSIFYSYDPSGNTTHNGRNAFTFDDASNLTCANGCAASGIQYGYDGKGWRVWQQKNGSRTYFQHAANGDLLFEYTPQPVVANSQWKQHVYLAGKRIATRSSDLVATTTSLAASNNGANELLSLTATVTPAEATGTVSFDASEGTSVTVPLVNGSATVSAGLLDAGHYDYFATYLGDLTYATSTSASVNVFVAKKLPTLSLGITPNPPGIGQPFTATVSVSGTGSPQPAGSVQLTVDTLAALSASIVNNQGTNQATFSNVPGLAAGTHTARAYYAGNAIYKEAYSDILTFTVGPPNNSPTVTLTAPPTAILGQATTLTATVTDADGDAISSVTYRDGTDIAGSSTTGPSYSASWIPTQLGMRSVTATARDARGADGVSPAAGVNVVCAAGNQPPTVGITSPANNEALSGPLTVSIATNATDPEGQLSKVEFFRGTTKIGESTASPWSFDWPGVGAGTYSLTAVATDVCGSSTTSSPVSISVTQPTGVVNGGFENPVASGQGAYGYQYVVAPSGWEATGFGYVANASFLAYYGRQAPTEGNQVAVVAPFGTLRQSVYLTAGTYAVRISVAGYRSATAQATVIIRVDGQLRGQVPVPFNEWTTFTTALFTIAVDGTHDLLVSTTGTSSDDAVFMDDIRFVGAGNPPIAFVNSGFESPVVSGDWGAFPSGYGWTNSSIYAHPVVFTSAYFSSAGFPAIPEGRQAVSFQSNYGIKQTIPLNPGNYAISVRSFSRPGEAALVRVLRNGVQIGSAAAPTGTWANLVFPFSVATLGNYTFELTGDPDPGLGSRLYLDDVRINAIKQVPQDFNADLKADLLWYRPLVRSATSWQMNGVQIDPASPSFGQGAPGFELIGAGDFNGDGKSDLLWFRGSDRMLRIQFMGGASQDVGTVGAPWELRAIADFNGDGKSDLMWFSPADRIATVWWMNGAQIIAGSPSYGQGGPGYEVIGAGDFNGDGKADLLWYRPSDRLLTIQFTDGGFANVGVPGIGWELRAIADLNGDGKSDMLWYRPSDRTVIGWWMNGAQIDPASPSFGQGGPGYEVLGAGDFNGDGKADVLWYRMYDRMLTVWFVDGSTATTADIGTIGAGWELRGVGDLLMRASRTVAQLKSFDLNGDARSDVLVRNTDGTTLAWLFNGPFVQDIATLTYAGYPWSITHTGDFNGDGKSDLLLKHVDGSIYVWSMNGYLENDGGFLSGAGTGWTVTHVADFDGDGKSDILIQHTDGSVYLWIMNGIFISNGTYLFGAGSGWSVTHVGDVNGDGKSDIFLRHTDGSTALWTMNGIAVAGSAGLTAAGSGWSVALVGDLNGDGKDDVILKHTDGTVVAWLMNGTTATSIATLSPAGGGWSPTLLADLNGDGKMDIVGVQSDGSITAWLMNGLTISAQAALLGPGSGWSVTHRGDFNGDGKADLLLKHTDGSVYVWIMDGLTIKASAIPVGAGNWSIGPAQN